MDQRNEEVLNTADVVAGNYIQKAGGGLIYGPGTSTSDSIPAMLSRGEYVVRASAVNAMGVGALNQINRMAEGGYAGPRFNVPSAAFNGTMNGVSTNSNNNNIYNIDISLNGTSVTADDVVRRFKQELALVNAKEGRSRYVGGQV